MSGVLVRVVDEAGLRDWHRVLQATESHDYVALPPDPIEDLVPALAGPLDGEDVAYFTAYAEGEPVAAVELRLPLHDNRDLANIGVHVHPDRRRRGHGRRVLVAALELSRERSRTRALVEVPERTRYLDPTPGTALVRSLGGEPLHAETRRLLDLAELTDGDVDRWHDELRPVTAGYSTVAWRDHTPDGYVEDMATLSGLMSTDAPQGDLAMEPEVWDAARYRELEASVIARRREHLTVAVRHDRSGRLVGFTELGVPFGGGAIGYQWDTLVSGEHRGHRLGLLLKLANLRELRRALPGVRYVNTWNADENTHMVAVNEQLGFRPMETWTEWGIDLTG